MPPFTVEPKETSMEHWVEFEPKFTAMPAEPAAMTVPPEMLALSQSMAPLPLLVGPLT